jgi:hypothetical protein
MIKASLKSGMYVKLRQGDIMLVVNSTLIDTHSYMDLKEYSYDLLFPNNSDYDIMQVTTVQENLNLLFKIFDERFSENLLWDRKKGWVTNRKNSKVSITDQEQGRSESFNILTGQWEKENQ